MEALVHSTYQALQRLVALHRQLLETVRMEREALAQADLKGIEEATLSKQKLIEGIRVAEADRVKTLTDLAIHLKKPVRELTLSAVAIATQGTNLKLADQLRASQKALELLIQRISEQNQYNRGLVEKSLEHIGNMKRNILGETVPKANTYTQRGQKSAGVNGARLISKEA